MPDPSPARVARRHLAVNIPDRIYDLQQAFQRARIPGVAPFSITWPMFDSYAWGVKGITEPENAPEDMTEDVAKNVANWLRRQGVQVRNYSTGDGWWLVNFISKPWSAITVVNNRVVEVRTVETKDEATDWAEEMRDSMGAYVIEGRTEVGYNVPATAEKV